MDEQPCIKTLKEAFYEKFPENHKILEYFEEANGCECTWENLTKVRLQHYVDFLSTKVAPNSVKTYCSRLKSILTLYCEETILPKDYNKVLQVKTDACQHVYLNDDEIKQIIKYKPRTRAEKIIKNWFLMGCLTGARHSDYIRFNKTNIRDGKIHYVSIKTHINTAVPLSSLVEKIINENNELGYNNVTFTDVYFNRILKRICKNAGINEVVSIYTRGEFVTGEKWKYIASHCARRSFATNLYKKGVDIYTISRLCGHSSVEMTKQYICCGPIISDSVISYLNEFSEE